MMGSSATFAAKLSVQRDTSLLDIIVNVALTPASTELVAVLVLLVLIQGSTISTLP